MHSDNDEVKRPETEAPEGTDAPEAGSGGDALETAAGTDAPADSEKDSAEDSADSADSLGGVDPADDPADGTDVAASSSPNGLPEGEEEGAEAVPAVAGDADETPDAEPDADSEAEEGGKEDGEDGQMTLLEHLGELRTRLVRAAIAVAVGMVACYGFAEQMFDILMQPMVEVFQKKLAANPLLPQQFFTDFAQVLAEMMAKHGITPDKVDLFVQTLQKSLLQATQEGHFQYTYPAEAFFAHIKISIVAGLFLVSPYVFAQIWGFIAPGLYAHERKWMVPMAVVSALFFVSGALFGYFIVFPYGFEFFASFSTDGIVFTPKLNEYLSFCLKLLFAFGLVFELPLFIFFLARMGMVSSTGLRKKRKYAILVAFVVAAILTPPDPFTQCLMAGPLIVLYELGIWVAFFFGKKEKRHLKQEAAEPDGAAEKA
ncbi:twin-arginine translocase subunit TatC [Pseudodesulfovibrio sp.]|uniref:twin-arginine translocase subunit TatC n=1 Tax=Pseudodesulfovibrio sp. TaxID=2035812 RepID=UPI0026313341|nr:twin-arginine translocase subunit TatC [Pseudodesulfovibrio sp.]MDD3311962.1 twin-arginine translocase subunit TatC [Pseudodesulfovibrio sp.]